MKSDNRKELMSEMKRFQSERANQIRKEAVEMLKNAAVRRDSGGGKGDQRRPSQPRGR